MGVAFQSGFCRVPVMSCASSRPLPEISSGRIALKRVKLCIRWRELLLRMSLHPARNGLSLKIRALRSPKRMRIGTGMPRMLLWMLWPHPIFTLPSRKPTWTGVCSGRAACCVRARRAEACLSSIFPLVLMALPRIRRAMWIRFAAHSNIRRIRQFRHGASRDFRRRFGRLSTGRRGDLPKSLSFCTW